MALKISYTVAGLDGVIEMVDQRIEAEGQRYRDGTVTGERKATAAVGALKTLREMLQDTTLARGDGAAS